MVKPKRLLSLLLRIIVLGATLAAVIIMATSHEKGTFFALSYEAKYSDTPAFKFFVIANAIVTVYGFLVLFIPSESQLWGLVLALDLVLTMLLISSISAALAVAQVGKKGNSSAGWLPVCGQVTKYCNQVSGALVAGFIAIITYIILLLYSIYTFLNPLLGKKRLASPVMGRQIITID